MRLLKSVCGALCFGKDADHLFMDHLPKFIGYWVETRMTRADGYEAADTVLNFVVVESMNALQLLERFRGGVVCRQRTVGEQLTINFYWVEETSSR